MDGAQWIDAFLSNDLRDEQLEQFQAWLDESTDHVDQFATACLLDSHLAEIVGQQQLQQNVAALSAAASTPRPAAAPAIPAQRSSFWRGLVRDFAREPMALAILLMVMLFGGLLIWQLSTLPRQQVVQQPKPPIQNPKAPIQNRIVARLEGARNAMWDETAWQPGSELRAGQRLILNQGIVEIALESGAKVIVEGPAEFGVGGHRGAAVVGKSDVGNTAANGRDQAPVNNSENACLLAYGKLVAHVPNEARGFTVYTPTHDIVDLGTEFGVEVKAEGGRRKGAQADAAPTSDFRPPTSIEVQVFQGEVSVVSNVEQIAHVPATQPQVLRAGQGVAADSVSNELRIIPADPARFVRELPAEGIASSKQKREPGAGTVAALRLMPGDVLAVSRYTLKLVKIDRQSGEQTLLVEGERGIHGTDWMCAVVDGRQRVLIGVGGLGLVSEHGGGIVRFDPQTGKLDVLAREGLLAKGRINSLAVASDGAIFASLDGSQDQIIQIDPETGAAKEVADFGSNAWGIAIDADGRSLLAASDGNGGEVARIQEGRVETWAKGAMVDGARGIAVLPGGRALVSVSYGKHSIVEIDRQSHRPTRLGTLSEEFGGILGMLAVEADGNLIVGTFLSDSGNVYRFDVAEGRLALLSSRGHLAHCAGVAVVPGGPAGKKGERP
jgi:ferric-dicitrate binding protein FerR (iron transport regulator)